ncbi:MAG: acyl-CoA dehydrogenase family protein [Myxococcota bacterium]
MEVRSRYQAIDDEASRAEADALCTWMRDYFERRVDSRLIDERRSVPPHVVLDFGERGLFGIQVETAFGGLGLRNRDVARVMQQAAALDMSVGTFALVCLFPGVRPIAAFSGPALRAEVLPALASGRMLAGYAQTEPGAGTHFQAMEARAVRGDGGWRVRGDKTWIGNSTWAGLLTTMARDVDAEGRGQRLTAFAIRTDLPGVVQGAELQSLGMRSVVQGELSFRDVAVGPDDVLGEPGRGLEVANDSMSFSRFAIAATCIGGMQRCAQLMQRFASRRGIATGPLDEHPVVRISIAEALAGAAATEELVQTVASALDADEPVPAELLAVCKVVGSEFLWASADRLVQTLGSRGYDEENLAPQLLRDARVTRIFEGTTEALLAYLGAAALSPRSGFPAMLRDRFGAPECAERLESGVQAIRTRGWPPPGVGEPGGADGPPRTWQTDRAGRIAIRAFVAAALAARSRRTDDALAGQAAAWARLHLEDECRAAETSDARDQLLVEPASLRKAVDSLADAIGDIDPRLAGERRGVDPLIRRDEPGA